METKMTLAEILEEYADRTPSPADRISALLRGENPDRHFDMGSEVRKQVRVEIAQNYCTTVEKCLEAIGSGDEEVRAVGRQRVFDVV